MTGINWQFKYGLSETDFTSSVLNFSITTGRQSYLDNYAGGFLSFTIKNQNNEVANFSLNTFIKLVSTGFTSYYVTGIDYNDYPGNTGLSTATITCSDGLSTSGRTIMTDRFLTNSSCGYQLELLYPSYTPPIKDQGTSSIASSTTYTGSLLQRINQNITTEAGMLIEKSPYIYMVGRNKINSTSSAGTFGRSGSNMINYQSFERIALGERFMNNVTVSPAGLASQVVSNTASISTYGTYSYSVATVDSTTTQALGLAEWQSYARSDPTTLSFNIGFDDVSQPDPTCADFLNYCLTYDWATFSTATVRNFVLTYRVPGAGSDTSVPVVVEGMSIQGTPDKTSFQVYLSPLTYYQFFTLNSSTFGILDTSRLGW